MGEIEEDDGDVQLKVVTLDNVSAAYYLLGIGLITSFVAYLGENIWFRCTKKPKKLKKVKKRCK